MYDDLWLGGEIPNETDYERLLSTIKEFKDDIKENKIKIGIADVTATEATIYFYYADLEFIPYHYYYISKTELDQFKKIIEPLKPYYVTDKELMDKFG